ncbi:UNVERIFIED_CONTAM: hypothetical protein PYX00_001711 [Menopon gallinae]|uniref:Uncharacterized protein n=1 Tax=Menopon gallinae TaxID=328185 RepID=A0AAW2IEV1_9NEOP
MEIGDECWDQVSPLLMNCPGEGGLATGSGGSNNGSYGCGSEEFVKLESEATGEGRRRRERDGGRLGGRKPAKGRRPDKGVKVGYRVTRLRSDLAKNKSSDKQV